jgi:hypothetical protein
MKKTKLSLAITGLLLVGAIVVTSCAKKTTTTTPTTDSSTTSSTDNSMAQQNAHDVTNFGSEGVDNGSLTTYKLANGSPSVFSGVSGSVSVTVTGSKQLLVTFVGFTGYDGHYRNGSIQYDWSTSLSTPTYTAQYYRDSGLVLNITTPNIGGTVYTVDGNTVHINNKTITNKGRINGQLTWTDNSDITITRTAINGGGTILWNGQWTIALLNTAAYNYCDPNGGTALTTPYPALFKGYGAPVTNYIDWTRALVSITGTFGGTASDGETYTGNISTPLVLNFNCAYGTNGLSKYLYVAGVLNFTPTGKATRTINYGSGACDLTYVVSIGSFSITITI